MYIYFIDVYSSYIKLMTSWGFGMGITFPRWYDSLVNITPRTRAMIGCIARYMYIYICVYIYIYI